MRLFFAFVQLLVSDVMRTDRTEKYFAVGPGAASEDSNHYDPSQNAHLKTLHDILVTYSMFNFDLSYVCWVVFAFFFVDVELHRYVQGMNDLLSPILTEMDDEVDAFWCFVVSLNRKETHVVVLN